MVSEPLDPPPADDFTSLLLDHHGRLVHKWLHYGRAYDRLLGEYRTGFPDSGTRRPVCFLEIGVSHGGSLELWREYLGEDAVIFGIDVDPRCAEAGRDDLHVRIGSQADEAFLRSVVKEMGGVDIVLDDGSHIASHQRTSFDVLFPLLTAGGMYVVEDLHTSYWRGWGGGFRRPGAFVEVAKSMVDGMHGWYHRIPLGPRSRLAKTDIGSISFFDSIVAIEKKPHDRPCTIQIGTPSF